MEINDGDLYQINGLTGFAIVGGINRTDGKILATDTNRGELTLVIDTNEVWKVKVPASVLTADPAVGALLYWAVPTAYQDGAVDLLVAPATAGDAPCAVVVRRKNAAGYLGVRVLNCCTGTA